MMESMNFFGKSVYLIIFDKSPKEACMSHICIKNVVFVTAVFLNQLFVGNCHYAVQFMPLCKFLFWLSVFFFLLRCFHFIWLPDSQACPSIFFLQQLLNFFSSSSCVTYFPFVLLYLLVYIHNTHPKL